MMKTLAESGLVRYEPYMGVRLTAAGEKLATLVLRRHRLVELFLVRIVGMSWAEVHDEAERLEHAVSERLIDRMDEMLGWPAVDPHGDPIPTAEGRVARIDDADLLTASEGIPLQVTRIVDQEPAFLRFIEQHDLMPGRVVVVVARDPEADSVGLQSQDGRRLTMGARAATKVLVRPLSSLA
jgi:DtxR family Mn-dependent transcriptional regulator